MRFTETRLKGAFLIELERREDDRGFFARTFCRREFEAYGLCPEVMQCNTAFNSVKGTVRGLHFQVPPAGETKLVGCSQGAIWDVIVDLRPDSPTHLHHIHVELTAENRVQLYVPQGFAHGYQTLTPNAEIGYMVSEYYTPGCERGLRYDDPAIGIEWPLPVSLISDKDANWPLIGRSQPILKKTH